MINKQKYKFNDRIHNQSNKDLSFKTKHSQQHLRTLKSQNSIQLNQDTYQNHAETNDNNIMHRLEKHIEFLQKKLEDSVQKTVELNKFIETIKERLGQKDLQSNYLQKQLAKNQEFTQKLLRKTQNLQSELQNMKLRSKIDILCQQSYKQKQSPNKTTLKHQRYKKGMFSSFSLANFSPQKSNQSSKPTINQQCQTILKVPKHTVSKSEFQNSLNQYLMQEWQRVKQEKNDKQLQNSALQNKIVLLKKQIAKKNKEIQILKSEKRQTNELAIALEKIRQYQRQYKILLMKLRDCQKKKNELAKYLKSKNDNIGESRIYRTSIEDIDDLIYKISKGLQIDRNIFDITILVNKTKKQVYIQTEQRYQVDSYLEKMKSSQILINKLNQKMVQKQQNYSKQMEKVRQTYEDQLKQYLGQIQQHRLQIQELNLVVQRYQRYEKQQDSLQLQRLLNLKEYKNTSIQCHIIATNIFEQRQDILAKAKILIDHNQSLQVQNKSLQETLRKYYQLQNKTLYDRYTQVQQYQLTQEIRSFTDQNLYHSRINQYKQQNCKLKKEILLITGQKQHFHHEYTEVLRLLSTIQKQVEKYRQSEGKKQRELILAMEELQDRNIQIQRYKKEIFEIQNKLRLHQQNNNSIQQL